ncbi:MAG TPA: hypothetical protein VEZ55_12105 [Chitinophagaceae bacterium]|jgi:hypothetical protein|nr:hypothetical protein [Chitinophagaceae bacterium]
MLFNFASNVHFTKLLKAAERLREFNFRKIKDPAEEIFNVDVADDRGNRIIFRMRKQDNRWQLTDDDLPTWITANENRLNDVISEEGY